jgi:23S rRNA (guanosine2251-2'-O)-methyltransferase
MNLICGINPVLEALGAGTRHFDRLLVVKGLRNRRISEAISRAGHLGIPLRFEARETLDRMAGGIPHQGLIAVVSAKPVISVEKLLEEAHTPALVVVLDGVEDPRNLGAILRTVEAAGADGVLLPDRHSAGLSETVSRASAGGLEHVRVAGIGNVVQSIEALKARGLWVVGFDASGTERWDTVDYRRPIALVLGGEGRGIRRLVREHCDHLVSIPLFGHVNSLNVSVAAGIALYEVVRQRGVVPSHVRPIPIRMAASPRIVGPAAEDGEVDPGHVAGVPVEEGEYEDDASRAEPVGLSDDEDRPAWAGPTVLKAVGGVRRDHGGRGGRHGHAQHDRDRDRGRGRGRADRRDGGRGPGGGHDEARGRPAAAPPEDARGEAPSAAAPGSAPRGPRRRRRRGGKPQGGPRPAGASGETGPRTGGPDNGGDRSGEGGGREHAARRTHAGGHTSGPHDGPAGPGGPSEPSPNDAPGGFQKRRRRRRRRH